MVGKMDGKEVHQTLMTESPPALSSFCVSVKEMHLPTVATTTAVATMVVIWGRYNSKEVPEAIRGEALHPQWWSIC